MTADAPPEAQPSLPAIAAHGLGGSRHELPAEPPEDRDFANLLQRLDRHRLIGLAAAAHSDGQLSLTDDQARRLTTAHSDAMCSCLHLEATLLDLTQSMTAVGVPIRVIKGSASAHLDYVRPELRHFGDLDVLVRSEDTDRATSVLAGLGYTRVFPEPRPGFDRRFGKGATFAGPDGTSVDLHRTFVMGPLGIKVDLHDVWSHGDSFVLAGESVGALAPAHRLLAACYNAVIGDVQPRLSTLRDIAQLCLSGRADTAETQDAAARWGAEYILARGITVAWKTLDIADIVGLSAWAARFDADHDGRRLVALYHDSAAGYAGLSWATARMLPLRDRVAFLRALAFPRGGRLGKRGWGLSERARRAARGYQQANQ